MFLQVSVCPRGGCLPQCMLGYQTPPSPRIRQTPRTRQTPPWDHQADPPRDQADTPPDQADPPPRIRQTTPPRDQADPPRPPGRHPPPRTRQTPTPTPPGKQTAAYGLRTAGTHPTGMHSCVFLKFRLRHCHCFKRVKYFDIFTALNFMILVTVRTLRSENSSPFHAMKNLSHQILCQHSLA